MYSVFIESILTVNLISDDLNYSNEISYTRDLDCKFKVRS